MLAKESPYTLLMEMLITQATVEISIVIKNYE